MIVLDQATACTVMLGPFVDAADAVTPMDALTIQKAHVRLSVNGGAFAAAFANQGEGDVGADHDENGWYQISLDATDTATLGRLIIACAMDGALPVWETCLVQPAYSIGIVASAPGYKVVAYTLNAENEPLAGCHILVTSSDSGDGQIANGYTDGSGVFRFIAELGATVYIWRAKPGYAFDDPDVEVVPDV